MSYRNVKTSTAAVLLIIGLIAGSAGSYILSTLPLKKADEEKTTQLKEFEALNHAQQEELKNLSSLVLELGLQVSNMEELIQGYRLNAKKIEGQIQKLNAYIIELEAQVDRAPSIWNMEPKISMNYSTTGCWWLEGYRSGWFNGSYKIVASRLRECVRSNTSQTVTDNFCNQFVNTYNDTVFVVVKSLKPEVIDAFLEVMNPPSYVEVKFRKGYATWGELENWKGIVSGEWDQLKNNGIQLMSLSITANATIMITILDIDLEKVNTVLDVLEGRVPPGILEIYRGELLVEL